MVLIMSITRFLRLVIMGHIGITSKKSVSESETDGPFLVVTTEKNTANTACRLEVSFQVENPSWLDRVFIPYMTIPFFAGAKGFLSKSFYFSLREKSFRGSYRWEDEKSARAYLDAYALYFMRRISIPGSLNYQLSSQTQSTAHGDLR